MTDVLRIKRRALGGSAGAPASLAVGELAYNEVDGGLYIGRSNGSVIPLIDMRIAQFNLINGKLVESHASNAATFAIKTLAGNDPSVSDPVTCIFPDASVLTLTAALSLTIASTVTVGTVNATPCRLWFALVNDAGTPRMVVRNCIYFGAGAAWWVTGFSANFTTIASPIGNNAVTTYGATTVATAKPHRVIGYADYDSGLATAGTWNVSPSRIVMNGPGSPLPGDQIQTVAFSDFASQATTSNTATNSTIALSLTPTALQNGIMITCSGDSYPGAAYVLAAIWRGTTTQLHTEIFPSGFGSSGGGWAMSKLDFPFNLATTSYYVRFRNSDNTTQVFCPWNSGAMTLQEIMG